MYRAQSSRFYCFGYMSFMHIVDLDLHDVHAVECLAWMDVHALACTRCYGANGLPLPTETSATPHGMHYLGKLSKD